MENLGQTIIMLKAKTRNLALKKVIRYNWYTFSSLKQSMTEDLKIIKNHSLIPSNIKVHGFIYEVSSESSLK